MGLKLLDNIKDDAYYLKKLLDDMSFICVHMSGISQEALKLNGVLLDSMMFRLIQISEIAKKLSNDFIAEHHDIPWNALFGLRNRIVHDYGNVDLTIVYDTRIRDIPKVKAFLKNV